MNDQLSELQNIALTARTKKTNRMDAQTRSRVAELLASVWSTSEEFAEDTVPLFDNLQSEAVADAVSRMWPQLTEQRRALFKRRIHRPTSERTTRRLALLIAAVIRIDGLTALEWLQILLPRDKQVVSKDVKQSISSVLFSSPPLPFESLSHPLANSHEVSRIYATLWEIAKANEPRAPLMARAKLAIAFARFSFANMGNSNAATHFFADLEIERRNWPADLQRVLDQELDPNSQETNSLDMTSGTTLTASASSDAEQTSADQTTPFQDRTIQYAEDRQPAAIEMQTPDLQSSPSSGIEGCQHIELLTRLIDNATSDLHGLATLGRVIQNLLNEKETLNEELQLSRCRLEANQRELDSTLAEQEQKTSQTDATISQLMAGVQELQDRLQSMQHQLADTRDEATRLRTEMDKSTIARENERSLLAQQIGANAAGRVDEFRKRLGGVLSRLAQDLPHKDAAMSPELGSAVLLLFHQFVDALQEQGIPVTTRKNAQ